MGITAVAVGGASGLFVSTMSNLLRHRPATRGFTLHASSLVVGLAFGVVYSNLADSIEERKNVLLEERKARNEAKQQ
ncbi:hypothetical protein CAOG_04777 [Capsaspora owczarzaki ATCC 30864]|uniref:Uncharacterized protein n=1 Tax=Capsaspora owczarzaki (strain ATCC 30864) TaxID=595528 RepID=A0A0D2X3C8_CAPO3|nr:hypothetical protein CAOG_04777 [Capsaspora owczarzaki ATCC 30864]KJE94084.1 hypothetical protein CAOG_004777 [Capsaspora owczarzaki ATCC 30864]|eukprot:XP_004347528.1 hypothetical protein CAOG_04777 [Capsaspora owczarzaki ATCC 30864]